MRDEASDASGRFLLRIDPGLHAALRASAAELGMSLNRYCAAKLVAPVDPVAGEMAAPVVARAARLFGEHLVGVVVFGSWVRGEATTESDVDLLVVVDSETRLSRSLYRRWDRSPLSSGGRPIEPHFVHLPDREHELIGTWAEVAVDGIVVFERGRTVSTRLISIRGMIADGKIVRRTAHGQPYWARAA